jgi:hypothetical protein
MATCDRAQVHPPGPGDCNTNPGVELVVQNLTFVDGNARGIADQGNNEGGGGAIRKLDYLVASGAGPARPAWIVNCTFGGAPGLGNSCANGGAVSSIGVSTRRGPAHGAWAVANRQATRRTGRIAFSEDALSRSATRRS